MHLCTRAPVDAPKIVLVLSLGFSTLAPLLVIPRHREIHDLFDSAVK